MSKTREAPLRKATFEIFNIWNSWHREQYSKMCHLNEVFVIHIWGFPFKTPKYLNIGLVGYVLLFLLHSRKHEQVNLQNVLSKNLLMKNSNISSPMSLCNQ